MSTALAANDAAPLPAPVAPPATPVFLSRRRPPAFARGADACECNTTLYNPVCPQGCTNCVERLIALPCGRSCPDNYCLPNPSSTGSSSSSKGAQIGGGVGGAIAVVALVVLALCIWRARNLRRARTAAHAREEARLRAMAEKSSSPRSRRAPAPSPVRTTQDDVEYTILRRDGLTTYEDDLLPPPPVRGGQRLSTSAATHLSRISERTEDHLQPSPLPPWTGERCLPTQRETRLPLDGDLSLREVPVREDVIVVGQTGGVRSFRSLATGATGSTAASQSTFPIPVIDTSPASNIFTRTPSDELVASPEMRARTHDAAP